MPARLSLVLLTLCVAGTAAAQTTAPQPAPLKPSIASAPGWPKANPADVDSPEHLVAALYDVISGPPTRLRDWNRFRSLFLSDGRLGVIRPDTPAADGKPARVSEVFFLTPEMYVERDDPFFRKEGFFERGIANRIESFGNLTEVWSTYESRHAPDDAKPFARGINSIQITHAAGRYWVASILWDDERSGMTLPEKYLKSSD